MRTADHDRVISPYRSHKCAFDINPFYPPHDIVLSAADRDSQRSTDQYITFTCHRQRIVSSYRHRPGAANYLFLIPLGQPVHISFGLFPVVFQSCFILKTDPVEICAAPAGCPADPATLGGIFGKFPRWHGDIVIQTPHHQRPVRVSVNKVDNDFMAHSRDTDTAKIIPRPGLTYPQPAGIRLPVFSVTIP